MGSLLYAGNVSKVCDCSRYQFWGFRTIFRFSFRSFSVVVRGAVGVKSALVTTWEGRTSECEGNPNVRGGEG